jgi:hypothetical protein
VTKERIRAGTDQCHVIVFKIFQQLLETRDFSRSYEGKVEWIKVQNIPLAFEICTTEIRLFTLEASSCGPLRSRLSNETHLILL